MTADRHSILVALALRNRSEAGGARQLSLANHCTSCGKPGCRCASDPAARHGPYYEWSHMLKGKLVHRRDRINLGKGEIINTR
jgi:hypothetical protein